MRGSSNPGRAPARAATPEGRAASHIALSYERLRGFRDELTQALYSKIQAGVASPQAFAAYARSLRIAPDAGACCTPTDVLLAFVRDVFLTGNGTLFVNNTFVEWAAVQALRRAQPRVLARALRRARQDEAVQQPAALLAAASRPIRFR